MHHAIAMLVWDKVIGFSTGLWALLTVIVYVQFTPEQGWDVDSGTGVLIGVPVLLAWTLWMLAIAVMRGFSRWLSRRVDLHRFGAEVREVKAQLVGPDWSLQLPLRPIEIWLTGVVRDVRTWSALWSPLAVLHTVLASLAIWALVAASLVCLAEVFGVNTPVSVLVLCAFATGAAVQIRVLPGGFGQVELTQTVLLASFGIPLDKALLLSVAYVISMRITNVVLGLGRLLFPEPCDHG